MTKKIFKSTCLIALAVFFASLVLIMGILYGYFSSAQMDQLKTQVELASTAVEEDGIKYLTEVNVGKYRITWVDTDGSVKYDNEANPKDMKNHLQREEIKQAFKTGKGESSRYSTTLMKKQLYSAKRLKDGTVLRVSCEQYSIFTLILTLLQPMIIVAIIAAILSFLLAMRVSKRIVKPLNDLDLDNLSTENTYEELEPLIMRIKSQQGQLKSQAAELRHKKEEFIAATKNMSEGIILLNEQGIILSINDFASKLLNIGEQCMGKDLLIFNNSSEVQNLLNTAESGNHCEETVIINDCKYRFYASPVMSDSKVTGIALIILDITEKEKAEQMRKEFTANVSHELKTPLQNISGCAELMLNNLVKSEDIPKFSKQIYTESKRMIALVEDIIKLSHLDEGASDMKRENTDLFRIAEDTVDLLMPVADDAGVALSLAGESAVINGVPQLLSAIVYNLCDNAIKYNIPGGSVKVEIKNSDHNISLSVSDTGIGIPRSEQDRIFERFYRVDKSHSKEVGGTGLGLSIVKHAAALHNAKISLSSESNKGTVITVTFTK